MARVGAAPAWSAITVAPTLVACCAAGAMIAALLAAVVRRTAGPPLVIAGASATVLAWAPLAPRGDAGVVELHVLDVGQGDALALRTPRGRWLLVDAGPGPPIAPDAGRRTIIPYVRRRGGEVATLVLTHPDLDHVGGAPTLLAALEPDALVEPGFLATSGAYEGLLDSALAHGVAWRPSRRGLSLDLDGVRVRVLAPDSAWLAAQRDPNEASTILRIEYGAMAMLLVGDAEREQEAWLLANATADELRADVLKVGHHGSRTSSTAAFLDAVRPRVALVSVGRGNRYGHPAPSVLAALAARGAAVFRTDVAGTLVLRTNGRSLELVTATGTWSPESSSRSAPAGAVSSPP
ncbi:MAG: MBL fold metallo-hydrolase [Gemmatimonadaceae bacterium]|nr:MBL fold metallo-hydrolase [Gemmatimonadaceae bacterium]